MYSTVLMIHSWIRWLALIAAVGAAAASFRQGEAAVRRTDRWGLALMISLDLQLLVGLLLYLVLSPFTAMATRDLAAAMRNPVLRFWAVEHAATMFAAVILVHVGRVLALRAASAEQKRTRLMVCLGLALLAMLFGMPWPGLGNGRPLFRL